MSGILQTLTDVFLAVTAPVVDVIVDYNLFPAVAVVALVSMMALAVHLSLTFLRVRRPWQRTTLEARYGSRDSYGLGKRTMVVLVNIVAMFEPVRHWFVNPLARVNAALVQAALAPLRLVTFQFVRRTDRDVTGEKHRVSSMHSPVAASISNGARRAARKSPRPAPSSIGDGIDISPILLTLVHLLTWGMVMQHAFDLSSLSPLALAWFATYAVWMTGSLVYGAVLVVAHREVRGDLRAATPLPATSAVA